MQLAEPGLAGFLKLKKLKKGLKKIVKPIVHVGAAYATGGASIPLSASLMKAKAETKGAVAVQRATVAAAERAGRIAPPADVVSRAVPQPTFVPDYSGRAEAASAAPSSGLPGWALPVGGVAIAALLLLTSRKG